MAPLASWGLLLALPVNADQAVLHMAIGDPARRDIEVPVVLDGITDTANGDFIAPTEFAARLASTGILLIGENHTNVDFHRVQLNAIRALHVAGRKVLIGLEMFPHTQQSSLDAWTQGHYTETGFVEQADWYEYWGYDFAYYRDIFVFARDHGLKMFGVNTPREVVTAVRKKGFKGLTEDEAAHVPVDVDLDSDEHRRMYRAFFDDDDAMHGTRDDEIFEGMFRAQCTWDATMGWHAMQALEQYGGSDAIMVVLIGSGHATYGLGVERQISERFDGRIASLIPVPVVDEAGAGVNSVRASYANFIWGVPQQREPERPVLGVSLMGSIGAKPTTIIRIEKHSVAERAGLRVGDVLLNLDGLNIESSKKLRRALAHYRWGDVARLGLNRNGQEIVLDVPFRRRPPNADD